MKLAVEQATGGKPRVLMVSNFLAQHGRNSCYSEMLGNRLVSSGWHITTTSARLNRVGRLLDMAWAAWRLRSRYEVALVEVYSGPSFLWAESTCATLRALGKHYILTLHGGNLPVFAKRRPGRVRRLLHSAAVVTSPSLYLVHEMRPWLEDIVFIANGLHVAGYPWRLRDSVHPKMIWLRAFHEIYNPALAPQVLARLLKVQPEAQLTMIGPDKRDGSLPRVLRVAEELGVSNRLTIIQGVPKEEVPSHLQQGDIFLNTTNVESFGVSVAEAMACGLCVVSTNAGGLPYWLTNDRDALLVPRGEADAMAGAVVRLLTEDGLAQRLSMNARRKAEEFDWSHVLPEWETLLRSAAADRRVKA